MCYIFYQGKCNDFLFLTTKGYYLCIPYVAKHFEIGQQIDGSPTQSCMYKAFIQTKYFTEEFRDPLIGL